MLMVSSLAVLGSRKDLNREVSLAKVFRRGRHFGEGGFFLGFFGRGLGGWGKVRTLGQPGYSQA